MYDRVTKKIVIDPYRGGDDIGNTATNLIEKDFNLEVGQYIYNRLKGLGIPVSITRDDDGTWAIQGKEVERIFKMTKFSSDEAAYKFAKKLSRMGIDQKLEELGAEEGDQVRILDFYFDYRK